MHMAVPFVVGLACVEASATDVPKVLMLKTQRHRDALLIDPVIQSKNGDKVMLWGNVEQPGL
jgi:hypothetical protein